jgi:hypothetical protein
MAGMCARHLANSCCWLHWKLPEQLEISRRLERTCSLLKVSCDAHMRYCLLQLFPTIPLEHGCAAVQPFFSALQIKGGACIC